MELLPEHQAALSRKGTRNEAAYEAYLKGRYFWNRRTEEGFAKAVGYFEQAIREDENYALAHAGLVAAPLVNGSRVALVEAIHLSHWIVVGLLLLLLWVIYRLPHVKLSPDE